MERRGRSVNIRAWPRVRGIVTCQLRLDTQQLNHQSNLVFNGFGHVCSYQNHIGGELLPVTMQTGAPLPLYYLHKTKHKQRKTLNGPLGMRRVKLRQMDFGLSDFPWFSFQGMMGNGEQKRLIVLQTQGPIITWLAEDTEAQTG